MPLPALYTVKLINDTPARLRKRIDELTRAGEHRAVELLLEECAERHCRLDVNGVGGNVYEYVNEVQNAVGSAFDGDTYGMTRSANAIVHFDGGEPEIHYTDAIAAFADLLAWLDTDET